jgi:predicted DNA-binding transcriptional regulator YafY
MSQTERIFYIDRMIREHGGVSARQICDKFEVSSRQAKRDIEYLRERLDAPIVWSHRRLRYEYLEPWNGLRFADETSFFAFAFLRAILDRYAYVPVVSEETTKLLKEKIGGRYISISDKVLYELPDMETIDGEVAFTMCQALLNNSALDISYIDAKGESSQRRIIPLRLINYAGKWYCIAFDSKSMELRTFSISRMDNVRAAGAPCFAIPSDDAIETYISSSYGIFKGEVLGIATLRFFRGAARAIRIQQWHKDQIIDPVPDATDPDAIDLSLPVHDWTEILGRALRCGSNCEVLGPPEFRKLWEEEIKRMVEKVGEK